jgi:hypothetical protein
MTKQENKELFHFLKNNYPELTNEELTKDQLLVKIYNILTDIYDDYYNKNVAFNLAKCFYYNYAHLYK